jgi:hypothetical protein
MSLEDSDSAQGIKSILKAPDGVRHGSVTLKQKKYVDWSKYD